MLLDLHVEKIFFEISKFVISDLFENCIYIHL